MKKSIGVVESYNEIIIISGATGAIGTALIRYALEQEMHVLDICHKLSMRIAWLPLFLNASITCLVSISCFAFCKSRGLASSSSISSDACNRDWLFSSILDI